jgi:hypothetical protein
MIECDDIQPARRLPRRLVPASAARLDSVAGGRAGGRVGVPAVARGVQPLHQAATGTDAFRRGMAMQAAVAESLLIPRIEAARQAARDATREQVEARRSGDSREAPAAKTRHDQAVAESQALTAELNNLPHRTGQRTTLEQDLAFAREVRDQARREAEHAQRVGDEPARQEAIARFREAAQEIREIQQEIANRARAPR